MSRSHAFGIGCFHFGYRKPVPFDFDPSEFVKEVKAALDSLPSLSELEVSFNEALSGPVSVTSPVPSLTDGENYFPHVLHLVISFNLYIPARVQDEIVPIESLSDSTTTESFRVTMSHAFFGPVAFVECIDADEACEPSSAVWLLREYLKREFSKLSTAVTFEYLGPSPFHADFYLEAVAEIEGNGFLLREVHRRGYDHLIFTYQEDRGLYGLPEILYRDLDDELGLYYDLQRRVIRLGRQGDKLAEDWGRLRELVDSTPSALNMRARYRIHVAAKRLVADAYNLQAQTVVEERIVDRIINEVYGKKRVTYLENYVRGLSKQLPVHPVEPMLKWAAHIEEGSFKQAEIAAVVLSAVGGGIIGSLATLWAASGG